MKNVVRAEMLKYRRASSVKLLLILPLVCSLLSAALTWDYFTIDNYNWWYVTLYPACVALVCAAIADKDKRLGQRALFTLPCDMGRVWDAKIITGMVFSGLSIGVLCLLTLAGTFMMHGMMGVTFAVEVPVARQLAGCAVMWLASLWQVPVCLWLAQKIGRMPTVVIHVVVVSFALLVALKPWYMMVPGAIVPRAMCALLGVLPNGLPAVAGSVSYAPELMQMSNVGIGVAAALLWLALSWVLSRKWFQRQVEK